METFPKSRFDETIHVVNDHMVIMNSVIFADKEGEGRSPRWKAAIK